MANHLQPTTSSLYTDFLAQLMARIDDSVKMLDSVDTAPTGIPVAAIRRNGLNVERWSGTAWAAVARMLSTDNAAALTALGVSAFIRQLLDDADAATARATLGAQASDATLTALAAITTAANKLIYATGSDAFSTTDFTAFARMLLDDADAATARTTLGLTIGTNVQAYDATLAALAGLALAADKMIYATGADQVATTTLTAFARSLLDDADAATARTTLGVSGAVDNYCKLITDWNDATTNGWYMGDGAANSPTTGAWYMGTVICHKPAWTTQFVHAFSSDSVSPDASKRYWRSQDNGVWTGWVSDNIPYTTAFARTLLDDADAAAARTTLGAAALASFTGVNSGNGYRKIPMSGGADLIIQWGSGTGVNITFPISFASACYAVTPVCIDGNQTTVNLSGLPSTTGFSVKKYYVNTQLDALAFNWIAVGV